MKSIEKMIHVFKVQQNGELFYAVCLSLLKDSVIQGSSKEQIEINIQYYVKNICMRDKISQLIYYIDHE